VRGQKSGEINASEATPRTESPQPTGRSEPRGGVLPTATTEFFFWSTRDIDKQKRTDRRIDTRRRQPHKNERRREVNDGAPLAFSRRHWQSLSLVHWLPQDGAGFGGWQ
jgi:hypothetical protein